MSRRDTIIIAVLVNAGILLVLFALAMPSKDQTEPASPALVTEKAEGIVQPEPQTLLTEASQDKGAVVDEIDQVLSEWNEKSAEVPQVTTVSSEEVSFPLETPKEVKVDEAATTPAKTVEVVVKKGDALDKIARAHGTTAQEIVKMNHLGSTKLQIGQVLLVPDNGKVKAKKSKPAASPKEDFYVVKKGDSPWTIASKNHIKLEELLKLNDLNESSAKKLKPGDKIRIK